MIRESYIEHIKNPFSHEKKMTQNPRSWFLIPFFNGINKKNRFLDSKTDKRNTQDEPRTSQKHGSPHVRNHGSAQTHTHTHTHTHARTDIPRGLRSQLKELPMA